MPDDFSLGYDRKAGAAIVYIDPRRFRSVEEGRRQITQYLGELNISTDGIKFKDVSEFKGD